jgi:hypothetical protein
VGWGGVVWVGWCPDRYTAGDTRLADIRGIVRLSLVVTLNLRVR